MKIPSIVTALLILFIPVFLFFGCLEKSSFSPVSGEPSLASAMLKKPADHQVVIVAGSPYAEKPAAFQPSIEKFGLSGSGGTLFQLVYPQSFTENKKTSLGVLSRAVSENNTRSVLTIGVPEGMVGELTKIRNKFPEMKIITIFSADEQINLEAVSNLVIDMPSAGNMLDEEESTVVSDGNLGILLYASVLFAENPDETAPPLEKFVLALESAGKSLKQKQTVDSWKVSSYKDPDTNLRSRNHIVVNFASGGNE